MPVIPATREVKVAWEAEVAASQDHTTALGDRVRTCRKKRKEREKERERERERKRERGKEGNF